VSLSSNLPLRAAVRGLTERRGVIDKMAKEIKGDSAEEFAKNEIETILGGPFVEMDVADLEKIVRDALPTFDEWLVHFTKVMTPKRARQIKQWREVEGYTWRGVAARTFDAWGEPDAVWEPKSNQIAGMHLCNVAMDLLGEQWS
jgi:hypothetical protein